MKQLTVIIAKVLAVVYNIRNAFKCMLNTFINRSCFPRNLFFFFYCCYESRLCFISCLLVYTDSSLLVKFQSLRINGIFLRFYFISRSVCPPANVLIWKILCLLQIWQQERCSPHYRFAFIQKSLTLYKLV